MGRHWASEAPTLLVLLSQYDWCSWIPNAPPTMRAPPPTAKGVVTIEQIVDTLPDRGRSCWHLGAVWALSQFQENEVRPGIAGGSVSHFRFNPILQPRVLGLCLKLDTSAKNPDSMVELLEGVGKGWYSIPGPQPGPEPKEDWQCRA